MSEEAQISPINNIIDVDTHPKHVRTDMGHVASRVNLRAGGSQGKRLINRKLKGTLLVDVDLPSGTNKNIGVCNDVENEAILYFIYNSSGNHCVYRYYTTTKVAEKVWYAESTLNLIDDELRAEVVEGKVYWTNGSKGNDNRQPLKGFNIDMAANYTAGETEDAYTSDDVPFDENIFTLIKKPPQFAPECVYDSDINYNFNNLRKKLFQFKYCYEYYDYQRSAWSSISKVPLPVDEIGADGKFVDDIKKNNVINIKYNTGSKRVSRILLAFRDTYPRNAGSFFKFEVVDKYNTDGDRLINDDSDEEITFYNNKITSSIDTEIGNRYCDWVPLSAKDIVLLDGKYLGIAYPEQGYEEVTPDYSLTAVEDEIETEGEVRVITDMVVNRVWHIRKDCVSTQLRYTSIDIPLGFIANAYYNIWFSVENGPNLFFSISTGDVDPDYPESVRDAFISQMRDYFALNHPSIYAYFEANGPNSPRGIVMGFTLESDVPGCPYLSQPVNLRGNVTASLSDFLPTAFKSLKRGQYHPFGLIYTDGYGRYNIVYADDDEGEMYSPLPEDDSDEELAQRVRCQWAINHRPPIDAVTYRWAYIRNKTYLSFQYFSYVKSVKGTGSGGELEGGNGIPNNKYFIELNQSLQRIRNRFPNFIISDYEWQNGDRIRVLGEDNSYEVLSSYAWVSDDSESGENGFLVDEPLCSHTEKDLDGNYYGYITLVEVYRPNPSPQDIYYTEIGEEYQILDPGTANRRHEGGGNYPNQSADLSTPAIGRMDFGDVYLRQRVVIDDENAIKLPVVEDEYFNDYYRSDVIDVGREGAKIESKNKFLNRVIRSENYLENTEYNLLNVFLPGTEYFSASDRFGPITGIENAGDVLKVLQPHKETSVYIGKNYVKQADGSEIVVASDKVFNSPREYTESRGTIYRKSMVSNLRYLYYFDETTGEFIRSAPNGQTPISSYYRNRTYFEAKAKELREYSGEKDVIVGINNDNDEVYITFKVGTDYETFVFSEEQIEENKGWMFNCELANSSNVGPENYANFGDIMFSFVDGQLWIHDQTNDLNKFYDKQHYASLEFYVNKYANVIKRFKNARISTNKNAWDIEMTIPEGLNYGNQKTLLKPTILRAREGQVVGDIFRNIIDKTGTESLSLLYRGEKMTGEYMKVKLSEETTDDIELREMEVKFLIST